MNCQTNDTVTSSCCSYTRSDNGFLIIVVLYILLAIILGSKYRNY